MDFWYTKMIDDGWQDRLLPSLLAASILEVIESVSEL